MNALSRILCAGGLTLFSATPAYALSVTNVTTTNFSNPDSLISGNSITREYASQTLPALSVTTSGAVTSFGSRLAFMQGMRVNQPDAPNFALIHNNNMGYEIEFTVEDPNNEGYVLNIDQAFKGCINMSREEPVSMQGGVGLLLGRIDAHDGNGPVHYGGFFLGGDGNFIRHDDPVSYKESIVDTYDTYAHPTIFTGTRTFTVSFSSFPSPILQNIFQNFGGGEQFFNFGLHSTHVGSGTVTPEFQFQGCNVPEEERGHTGIIHVVSQNPNQCVPSAEMCDGIDNDCDGFVDEDFNVGASCSAGVGACQADGVLVCTEDGLGTMCSAEPLEPQAEMCDGTDNNCNGVVDDVDEDGDGILECNGQDLCPGTVLPEFTELKAGHYGQLDADPAFEIGCNGKNCTPLESSITLEDTMGCSCTQLMELAPGKKKGLLKHGCPEVFMSKWLP